MKRVLALCLIGFLAACGGDQSRVINNQSTMGQELIDLKKAYDEGLITEKEYNKARRQILRGQR